MKMLTVQFIIDGKGEKSAAVVPIKIYLDLLEQLEELEDIKLYNAVKNSDEPSISLNDYRQQRQKRKQQHALSNSNS